MRFLRAQEIVDMHDQTIMRTGGETGILAFSSLESAVDRHRFGPFHGPGDAIERAAYLFRGIIQDHPFVDGNKRTAVEAALEFLRLDGVFVRPHADDLVAFAVRAAQGLEVLDIERWLRDHAQRLNPTRFKEDR